MKRIYLILITILITITILFSNTTAAKGYAASPSVLLNINGQRVTTDVPPVIISGRTYLPARAVFEKLGATVNWDSQINKVTVTYNDKTINLVINYRLAEINNQIVTLDTAPFIKNGRTMIPARFVAENLGMTVSWYAPTSLVTITSPLAVRNLGNTTVLGFTTNDYNGDNYSYNSLKANYSNLNSIATFSYQIGTNGNLVLNGKSQQDTVNFVNSNKIKPLVLIHNLINGSFNSDLAHSVLSDSKKRQAVIDNLLLIMGRDQYSGVNIDIENLIASDRSYYSTFIQELKEKLAPLGFMTTVSIPAKTSDMLGSKWSGGYDYAAIGKYADQILLMTYDEHYFGGPAGPIASAPWVENVLKYATSQIPSEKILLGIAGYGYDWASTGNKVVTYNGVENVLAQNLAQPQWNDTAKSPFYKYTLSGVQHTVWYENFDSISYKLNFVSKYSLGGIGIWKLGYENSSFWNVINGKLG